MFGREKDRVNKSGRVKKGISKYLGFCEITNYILGVFFPLTENSIFREKKCSTQMDIILIL